MRGDLNNPKTFSRELDALLKKINNDATHENFISSIFVELEQNFGKDLNIVDGCIYDLRDKEFVKIYSLNENQWSKKIQLNSPAIQKVIKHGSYIFNDIGLRSYFDLADDVHNITPAAITINTPERQLLLVFALLDGWIREEISLFLNAVRMALTFRLFSDIMDSELQQAVQIQKSLLPRSAPKIKGYDIYGKSIPATLVGGDFYEYFEPEEGNFGISIGDASGHGLPAALLVRDVVIGLRMGLASEYKLAYTVKKLNHVIQQSTYASNFVSLFLAEIENNGHCFYVNAGHPAPFLVQGDKITDLEATGMVLGFLKNIQIQRSYVRLQPGEVMVMYTDGIIERIDSEGSLFELNRLKDIVLKHQHKSSAEISEIIFQTVYTWGASTNWEDDATVVVMKRL